MVSPPMRGKPPPVWGLLALSFRTRMTQTLLKAQHIAMHLSLDSIVAIIGVLVALPPSILIIITAARRRTIRHSMYSLGQHQDNTSYSSLSTVNLSPYDFLMQSQAHTRTQMPRQSYSQTPPISRISIQMPLPAYQPPSLGLARATQDLVPQRRPD
jgi:hypothetical protein